MRTLYDYVKAFADKSLKEVSWNIVDNMLCSIISYFPFESYTEEKDLNSFCYEVAKLDIPKDHWYDSKKTKELAALIINSRRYKDAKFSNFIYRVDNLTQFGALTIKIGKIKIISFTGSDGSAIGWCENLRLSYLYPTISQNLALDYLKNALEDDDKEVYVVGHSKGGNLAMSSVMELDDTDFNKIKCVCNFDGPGFLKEQYESLKYVRMQTKLINVLPQYSYIGCLMHNDGGKLFVVKTNGKGINVHFPNRWEVFGTTLINSPLDKRAIYFNRITAYGFDELNREETGKFIEVAFKDLLKNYNAMIKITGKEVLQVFNDAKKDNLKMSRVINKIMLLLFAYSRLGERFRKKESSKELIEIQKEADEFMKKEGKDEN